MLMVNMQLRLLTLGCVSGEGISSVVVMCTRVFKLLGSVLDGLLLMMKLSLSNSSHWGTVWPAASLILMHFNSSCGFPFVYNNCSDEPLSGNQHSSNVGGWLEL